MFRSQHTEVARRRTRSDGCIGEYRGSHIIASTAGSSSSSRSCRPTPRLAPLDRHRDRREATRRSTVADRASLPRGVPREPRQGVGSDEEHLIGDFALRDEGPEPDPREAEGIVRLTDDVRPRATTDGVERAARGDDRSTSGPFQDVPRLRFRPRRRVRQREGHGEPSVHGHLGDGGLGECPGSSACSDQEVGWTCFTTSSSPYVWPATNRNAVIWSAPSANPSLSASSGSRPTYVRPRESSWTIAADVALRRALVEHLRP